MSLQSVADYQLGWDAAAKAYGADIQVLRAALERIAKEPHSDPWFSQIASEALRQITEAGSPKDPL